MPRQKNVEKVSVSLPRELLEKIEDYRFRKRRIYKRIPSRSRVITVLLEKALRTCGENDAEDKVSTRSSGNTLRS